MIRIGIAGVGAIAKAYIELIAQGKINGKLCAMSSRSLSNMQAIVEQYGLQDVTLYTDYSALLVSGKIDIVLICTPHELHPDMAVQAIAHGIHPLIEKPLGVNGGQAQRLLAAAQANPQICCGVLYCRRMSPAFRYVKGLIDQGKIGSLKRANWMVTNLYRTDAYHCSGDWRGTYRGEGGGVLMTQASHQLDLYLWLCGMPCRVHAFCRSVERKIEVENEAVIYMEFANGASGQFIASSHEFPGSNRLELSGDGGQIIVEDDSRVTCTLLKLSERQFNQTDESFFGPIPAERSETVFTPEDNRVQQAGIINDFITAATGGTPPVCPLNDAVASLLVINAAYLSAWNQQTVELPLNFVEYDNQFAQRCRGD